MNQNKFYDLLNESVLILEARSGRVYNIKYDDYDHDPNPRLLYLGKFRHPETKNVLIGGINLNYLDDNKITQLKSNLPDIMKAGKTLKARWQKGHDLLPDIFPGAGYTKPSGAYRTYKDNLVHIKSISTLSVSKKPLGPAAPATKAPASKPVIDKAQSTQDIPVPDIGDKPPEKYEVPLDTGDKEIVSEPPEPVEKPSTEIDISDIPMPEPSKPKGPQKPVRTSKKVQEKVPVPAKPTMPKKVVQKPQRASQIQAKSAPEVIEPAEQPETMPSAAEKVLPNAPEISEVPDITPDDIPMPGKPEKPEGV